MSEENKLPLTDVVSVAGTPGLHKVIGRSKQNLIVESLDGSGKRFPVQLTNKVSVLSEIAIYTETEDMRLAKVFNYVKQHEGTGASIPSSKASHDEIRAFMKTVLPEYDAERVYDSDIKKLLNWYVLLKDMIDFEAEAAKYDEAEEAEAEAEA